MVGRRRRRLLFTSLCFVLVWLLVYLLTQYNQGEVRVIEYNHLTFDGTHSHRCSSTSNQNASSLEVGKPEQRKKLILFYTTIFDRIPVFYPNSYKCCRPFDCILTIDKSKIGESDAVVFHTRDMPARSKMPTKERVPKQRWIFYTLENPYNSKIVAKEYNDMFNWTMSYERRSDIFYPYGFYQKKANVEGFKATDFASKKDKFAMFVNSHCRTLDTIRENFVRALSKQITVDAYGECRGIFGRMMCPRNSKACGQLMKRYKFTLAFENVQCNDYITEKYWDLGIKLGIVPVVYGGPYFNQLAIPGSYIDASQFKDAGGLAKYLTYLDKNDTAYNEYFKWKEFYEKADIEPWPCRLCQMLHNSLLPQQSYKRFDQYLDPAIACAENRKHFRSYGYG